MALRSHVRKEDRDLALKIARQCGPYVRQGGLYGKVATAVQVGMAEGRRLALMEMASQLTSDAEKLTKESFYAQRP